MTDEEMSASQTAAPLAVSVKTYHHNIPTTDNPEDHSEGNCPCDPIVDEDAGTVTHQPMPALNAASGPDATFSRALFEYSAAVEDYARESLGWTWAQRERGMQRRVDCVSELWRLYRAATGEVVGRGEVVTVNPDLGSVEIELDGVMPVLPAVGTRVVLRREKEEG